MIKVSSLMAQLGKAMGTATPSLTDSNLTIPPTLQPIISAPESLEDLPGNPVSARLTSSWNNRAFTIANAAGVSVNVLILGPGLWELFLVFNYFSNYIGAPGDASCTVNRNDSALSATIISLTPSGTATVPNSHDIVLPPFRILTQVGITIGVSLGTNGAGQSHNVNCSLLANRLA